MNQPKRYTSKPKPNKQGNSRRGQAQALVYAALQIKGWNVADLADAAQVQAPDLLDWLEAPGDKPAPRWLQAVVQQHLGISLPAAASFPSPNLAPTPPPRLSGPIRANTGNSNGSTPLTAATDTPHVSEPEPQPGRRSVPAVKTRPRPPHPGQPNQGEVKLKANRGKAASSAADPRVNAKGEPTAPAKLSLAPAPAPQSGPVSPPLKEGQAEMLRALLRKKGWDEAAFAKEAGKALTELSQSEARQWIAYLNQVTKGQPAAFKANLL